MHINITLVPPAWAANVTGSAAINFAGVKPAPATTAPGARWTQSLNGGWFASAFAEPPVVQNQELLSIAGPLTPAAPPGCTPADALALNAEMMAFPTSADRALVATTSRTT
jgi:hypothetical protein